MKEIVNKLHENRQIELAKEILESNGYKVSKKLREDLSFTDREELEDYDFGDMSGKEFLSIVGKHYNYWEDFEEHIELAPDSFTQGDNAAEFYKNEVVSRITSFLGVPISQITVGCDISDLDELGAVSMLLHSKGEVPEYTPIDGWEPEGSEITYTNLGGEVKPYYSFYKFKDGSKFVVGTEEYSCNLVFISKEYL